MAFSYKNSQGRTYYLHSRETVLKNGRTSTIYFFAREEKDGIVDDLPPGYQVAETDTGLPVLKKEKK